MGGEDKKEEETRKGNAASSNHANSRPNEIRPAVWMLVRLCFSRRLAWLKRG